MARSAAVKWDSITPASPSVSFSSFLGDVCRLRGAALTFRWRWPRPRCVLEAADVEADLLFDDQVAVPAMIDMHQKRRGFAGRIVYAVPLQLGRRPGVAVGVVTGLYVEVVGSDVLEGVVVDAEALLPGRLLRRRRGPP